MKLLLRTLAAVVAAAGGCAVQANERVAALNALVAAYPDHLLSHNGHEIVWRDGTRMPISDGRQDKSFDEMLANPDIDDMFAIPYGLGPQPTAPPANNDPGRIRNQAFFLKMYGDCRRGGVTRQTQKVHWLRSLGGPVINATSVNGIAERLQRVSDELEKLPQDHFKFLRPISGIYNCRPIAGTQRLSMHAFAAAIDINASFGDYWRWMGDGSNRALSYRNRIPYRIVEIFERHGFIWGGKWYHFDTLHFEYRPELLLNAGQKPAGF